MSPGSGKPSEPSKPSLLVSDGGPVMCCGREAAAMAASRRILANDTTVFASESPWQ